MGAREVATFDCSADKSEAVQFTPFPQLEMGQGSPLRSGSISVSRQLSAALLHAIEPGTFLQGRCGVLQPRAAGRNGDNPAARTLMHGHHSFATLGARVPLPRGCPDGCQRTLLCRTGRQANKACPFATSWPQGLAARSQKNG